MNRSDLLTLTSRNSWYIAVDGWSVDISGFLALLLDIFLCQILQLVSSTLLGSPLALSLKLKYSRSKTVVRGFGTMNLTFLHVVVILVRAHCPSDQDER